MTTPSFELLQQRLLARGLSAPAKLADERARNRQDMPIMSAIVDDLTAHFGKLQYGKVTEGGRTIVWGRKSYE